MWTKLVDMEMDDEESMDCCCPLPVSERPRYPYGLRICFTHDELKKLNLTADCEIGDMIDMRVFATVTSISVDENKEGPRCRIEMQIEKIALENEMTEAEGD